MGERDYRSEHERRSEESREFHRLRMLATTRARQRLSEMYPKAYRRLLREERKTREMMPDGGEIPTTPRELTPDEYTPDDVVVLAREAAAVLRGFYDDLTPCIHRLKRGERCALCGRARALLVECDGIVSDAHNDGPGSASG